MINRSRKKGKRKKGKKEKRKRSGLTIKKKGG